MIRSFKDKEAIIIWSGFVSKKYNFELQRSIRKKLWLLHYSQTLLDLHTCRLEKLKGNRKHQYSIRVNRQYRICFEWSDNDAHNVEIIDYHK